MCGKCEPIMAKAGVGLGVLCVVMAGVSRLACIAPLALGPKAFAAMAALMFLMAIAVNTSHKHE